MKIFLLFYMCHFAMGLTHCYKTTVFFTFIKTSQWLFLRRVVKIADWLFLRQRLNVLCTMKLLSLRTTHPSPVFHSMVPKVCLLYELFFKQFIVDVDHRFGLPQPANPRV